MKSYRALLIALFSFFFINLNAQVFVGGNVGLNIHNGKTDDGATTTYKASNYSFSLYPKLGIFLSEKFATGVEFNISLSGQKTGVNTETISRSTTIGVVPFLRYYAINWNKFSVFGQGNIGLDFTNSSEKTEGSTTDGSKTTRLYLNFYPGLSYNISDKLSFETSLNILSFGYYYYITKDGSLKNKNSSFNMGAGIGDIISVSNLTIGAIYKF